MGSGENDQMMELTFDSPNFATTLAVDLEKKTKRTIVDYSKKIYPHFAKGHICTGIKVHIYDNYIDEFLGSGAVCFESETCCLTIWVEVNK